MARSRISRQPSPYPSGPFHTVRLTQLLSSMIVTAALSYFVHYLAIEGIYIPWTFIVPLVVSVFTIVSFAVTVTAYHQRTLKPRFSAFINAFLFGLWVLAFGLQVHNLRGTLSHRCTLVTWQNELGIHVCRVYKTLAAFTTIGLLSTILALLLDFWALRHGSSGAYNSMRDSKTSVQIFKGNQHDVFNNQHDNYDDHGIEFPDLSHRGKPSYKTHNPIGANQFGYAAPSEQTSYDSYGSSHLPAPSHQGGYSNGSGYDKEF